MFDETKRCYSATSHQAKAILRVESVHSAGSSGAKEPTVLGVMPGTFYDTVMPETAETMWGPVPLARLPQGQANSCKAVVNR